MSHSPEQLVSVVVPAHNGARTLPRTLASALAQTHAAIEVLVVDDGSTDATAELVESVARADPRVRLISQANAGVAAARNRGISEARGAFLAVLDADDLWHPEKLAKQVARLGTAGPETALVYCWRCTIDGDDRLIRAEPPAEERREATVRSLLHVNFICASAPLMRIDAVRAVGGYDSRLRARGGEGAEDLKLYLQLAMRYRLEVVPEVLVAYRVTPGSMSQRIREMRRSHELVLTDIRELFPAVPERWFVRGHCRADFDASARLMRAGRFREAGMLLTALLGRHLFASAREILSWHGLSFPLRLRRFSAPRNRARALDWPIPVSVARLADDVRSERADVSVTSRTP